MTRLRFWNKGNNRHREKGQSIVEFALLAPVLIILFMGMFDFGWILHQQIQMDNATRDAARRAAVGATNAEILTHLNDALTFPITSEQVTIDVLDKEGNSIGDNSDRTPDNIIHVGIDRDNIQLVTPLANLIEGLGPINLHSEAEFLIE
jgi:hypothetical protein